MSIFDAPMPDIQHGDLLCAIILLSILSLKVMTLKQNAPWLARFNRLLSIILYPVALTFGLVLFQWIVIE